MKLYNVKMWFIGESEQFNSLVLAESVEQAEQMTEFLDLQGYDCFEAEEVNEVNGYRIIFEKIEE